ncbi:YHS domain-containing (seleno)protein [Alteromonas sp. C1M14]|uniref:YHS domain-containing (seleno)protein n=1 Tax=Alteromonas sp. C1M14 TaxID=2841567 RepID=UPI001C08EB38|nr:YHS domain-containing (seleno)protein [Alteromonas sp. C1M14]MBU2976842.1 YHS domain-containing protein [Alteromonas sp. C1M14]
MKKLITLFIALIAFSAVAEDEIYTGFFSNKAVGGYDTVAFFSLNEGDKPVKGSSEWSTEYKNADWYFSSAENLSKFKADPERYMPQYGGYCAWAVSAKNDFAPGDPQYWAVVDGKLYLNYNQNVKTEWDAARARHIVQADLNWPTLIK